MSFRYKGGVISATPPTTSTSSATGMWTLQQQLQAQAAGSWPSATYEISRSLRFNSADSTYLTRTPASASNRKTWTWSGWVKRSALSAGGYQNIFQCNSATGNDNNYFSFRFMTADTIGVVLYSYFPLISSAVLRDFSAWYHFVLALDTTQATASNRLKLYINGSEVTAWGTDNRSSITQNSDLAINLASAHRIGSYQGSSEFFSGYMAEVHFIDGQALTPSSFGQANSTTGVWQPKEYAGTYGTNGFYLNFNDNSSTAALGTDYSGNGNTWTPNNFSVTAGAGNDSLVDTPTSYGTDTGAGGTVRGNYATMNPLSNTTGALSNGNLQLNGTSSVDVRCNSTMAVSSGKWYFETTLTTAGSFTSIGIGQGSITNQYPGKDALSYVYTLEQAYIKNNDADTSYGSALTSGDVFMCAFDLDNNKVFFGKNGTWFNSSNPATGTSPAYSITAGTYGAIARPYSSGAVTNWNFGQRPFAYTAPSGFKALVTTNLPDPTVVQGDDYFNAVLWTGASTSSSRSITGVGFQPDFVWVKSRNQGLRHSLYDAVRGVGKELISSSTSPEVTNDINGYISAFDSDGFSTTPGSTDNERFNASGYTYVAWNWNAGGSTATNTDGTISAQVRANPTAGVSIATYTGTGVAGSIGHGLGATPKLYIIKSRSSEDWYVFTTVIDGSLDFLILDTTDAKSDSAATSPTSTVVNVLTAVGQNQNGINYVMYAFAAVPGFSAMGSYTGNGSTDGPFIYTGFRPAFVLIKQSSAAGNNWTIVDDKRDDYNVADLRLFPNASDAESSSYVVADLLSNGFKVRGALGSTNTSSATYIYMAFAENPFKYALAR